MRYKDTVFCYKTVNISEFSENKKEDLLYDAKI